MFANPSQGWSKPIKHKSQLASLTTFQAFMATSKSSPVMPTALPSTGKGKYLAANIKSSQRAIPHSNFSAAENCTFVRLHLQISLKNDDVMKVLQRIFLGQLSSIP